MSFAKIPIFVRIVVHEDVDLVEVVHHVHEFDQFLFAENL